MVFTAFCGRALWRALCVHCTCTVQNTVCEILLLEAWRHILCLWVAAVKMNVSLDCGCSTCKREFVQACVCTSINEKTNLLRLCLVGSSFEDESVFGLRFWQVQKVVCSSLCLHIPKPKKSSPDWVRVLQKNSHPVKLIAKKLACPLSPNSMLLHRFASERPSKKTAISVRMPACIGQQQWSRGRGGIRCDVTTCRRISVFFEEPGEDFLAYGCANTSLNQFPFAFAKTSIQAHSQLQSYYPPNKDATDFFFRLWMCKRKLEQIPFCTCQNPNPNTLSSSELLPTNKEATLQHLLRMWAKIGDQSCVSCMVH